MLLPPTPQPSHPAGEPTPDILSTLPDSGALLPARNVALIYNWWSLFVRCVEPQRPREAVTSRPLMLSAIGREVRHAGQTTVVLTSTHAEAGRVQRLLTDVSLFLSGLRNTAEQMSSTQCWQRIWERILTPFRVMEAASCAWFSQLARLPA